MLRRHSTYNAQQRKEANHHNGKAGNIQNLSFLLKKTTMKLRLTDRLISSVMCLFVLQVHQSNCCTCILVMIQMMNVVCSTSSHCWHRGLVFAKTVHMISFMWHFSSLVLFVTVLSSECTSWALRSQRKAAADISELNEAYLRSIDAY